MKKSILAVVTVVVALVFFAVGFFVSSALKPNEAAENVTAVRNEQKNDAEKDQNTEKEEEKVSEKVPKNVFFSPYTGSDDGNGEMYSPAKTLEQAQKIGESLTLGENEELVILEYMMTVNVKITGSEGTSSSAGGVNMIFFGGSADSYYFKGDVVGTGCDTQKYPPEGGAIFSARYMLRGKDCDGKNCSIFIENNGTSLDLCTPTVITDSAALSDWQSWNMRTIVVPVDGGVDVNVYRIH